MAKQRYVNTKFWSDNWIVELDPLERYLFLYLLTNEHTNIAGVYELPLRVMAFESGIDKEMLPKMLKRFGEKVAYIDGWVCLKNFQKHQSTTSKNVKKGIEVNMAQVPENIRKQIPYEYPMDTPSRPIIYSNSNLNSNSNTSDSKLSQEIVLLIKEFETINIACKKMYGNKTQREACKDLIEAYGFDRVLAVISQALPKTNQIKYMPTITTPHQLFLKWSQLEAGVLKMNQEKPKHKVAF